MSGAVILPSRAMFVDLHPLANFAFLERCLMVNRLSLSESVSLRSPH